MVERQACVSLRARNVYLYSRPGYTLPVLQLAALN